MYDFDDIRPYYESEFREAYYKLMDDPRFQDAVAKFLPNYTVEDRRCAGRLYPPMDRVVRQTVHLRLPNVGH